MVTELLIWDWAQSHRKKTVFISQPCSSLWLATETEQADYIICRVWCKIKLQSLLLKKQEKGATRTSQVALVIKNPPTKVGAIRGAGLTPGSGRSLEEAMAIHSNIPAWRIPWTEEPGGL